MSVLRHEQKLSGLLLAILCYASLVAVLLEILETSCLIRVTHVASFSSQKTNCQLQIKCD